MANRIIGNISGFYKARYVDNIACSSQNDVSAGYAVRFMHGAVGTQVAHATTDMNIDGICIKGSTTSGYPVIELAGPGALIECDYTGTKSTSFTVGVNVAILNTSGTGIDAATITAGYNKVMSIDTVNTKLTYTPTHNFCTYTTS